MWTHSSAWFRAPVLYGRFRRFLGKPEVWGSNPHGSTFSGPGGVVRPIISDFRSEDTGSNPVRGILSFQAFFQANFFSNSPVELAHHQNLYKLTQNTQLHEEKLKTLEEKRPDALEVAAQENEEGKEEKNQEVILFLFPIFFY